MSVTPSAWLANSLLAVETVLANCATFRALMAAATVADSRERCIWQDSRTPKTAPFAVLILGEGSDEEAVALRVVQHVDEVRVLLVWAAQEVVGDSEKDKGIRELNSFGALLSEIAALVGTASHLARAKRSWEPPEREADDAQFSGCWTATITFSWSI